ncbi:MAG TPA: tyrosine-type recombinase/integrase [Solirubrobacteraceae bacterium]
MNKHHFITPDGPLGPFANDYEKHLVAEGHPFGAVQHRLTQFSQISKWLETEGLEASDLDEAAAERFAAARRAKGRVTWSSPANMRLPLAYLRDVGAVPARAASEGPFEELLSTYGRYLLNERGLGEKTVAAHLDAARRICSGVASRRSDLADLRGAHVTAYLLATCLEQSPSSARATATAARSLFTYLYLAAITPTSLRGAVPRVARRRGGSPPRSLSPAQVVRLLNSCDRRRGVGPRDYAVLLLLARLGLRPCEVTALRLDDIDWHHGELVVRGKGNHHERLPLPEQVGAAVADYLRRGRPTPPEGGRTVFLRARAPWTPLGPAGVPSIVRLASQRSGLEMFGARRLRQHAATEMHRAGMDLAAVAEVLRHRSTLVTTVYVNSRELHQAGVKLLVA